MNDKEKLFQECMDGGKNYFFKHKNVRPSFISFHQEMLKYFGGENSNVIEKVYYRLIRDLSATKIFGFDSDKFKSMLNNLTDMEEAKRSYGQGKNKAEELLKALNSYRSEYYYKIEEVYRGKSDDDRLREDGYFKKGGMEPDSYKEERLKYYTEGINNNTLIEIFSYEFLSNYSDIDTSERSYAKMIIDKIEEEIIKFLGDITRHYNAKLTAKPAEAKPEPTGETTKPIEAPEPAKITPKPAEVTPKTIKAKPKLAEAVPKPTKVVPASKSAPERISIGEEQVDIVRIFEAMYSSGIISAKTGIEQVARLFFNDPEGIDKFVTYYNNQKNRILEEGSKSNSKNLKQFIKLLLNELKKSDVKDIVEHLINIHFEK